MVKQKYIDQLVGVQGYIVVAWNAEVLGWHVCKIGNRFAALRLPEPGKVMRHQPQLFIRIGT